MPIGQRAQHVAGVHASSRLVERQLQFASPPLAADCAERSVSERVSKHISRFAIYRKAESGRETCGPPDTGRVVVKAAWVKDAQPSLVEVFDSSLEIDDRHRPRRIRGVECTDQRIDAEVPTPHVLSQAARLDVGQCSGLGIRFMSKLRQIDLCAGRLDSYGAESIVRNDFQILARRLFLHGLRECSGIPLDDEIDIDELPFEQQIADRPSYEMNRRLAGRCNLGDPRKQCTGLIRHRGQDFFETEAALH